MRSLFLCFLAVTGLASAVPAHPRLFFPDPEIAPLKERIKTDPLARRLHEQVLADAQRVLGEPTVRYEIPDGLRLLSQSRDAITRILRTAYAWRMTGDRAAFDRCVKELDAACALQDWNPKHFLDVGEMATAVAIGYDWLYPELTPEQRKRYEEALAVKALEAINGRTNAWWMKPTNNWSQVCAGGIAVAADALLDVRPDLAKPLIERTHALTKECEAFYKPDGAYPEGPAYWHYGTTYHVLTLALEERDGAKNLDPIWTKTGRYLIDSTGPSGMPFNFADAGPGQAEISPAQSWLASRTKDGLAISHFRSLLERRLNATGKRQGIDRFLPLTLLWMPAPAKAGAIATASTYGGEQSLAFFRSSRDADALWLGIKGGTPAASHGQMDVGSFVLDWAGSRWIHDLGSDDYNLPAYFGSKRFTYFRLQNLSHNTLVIGGALQNPKAEPCPVTPVATDGTVSSATFDLSPAYLGQCTKLTRRIDFDAAARTVRFTDTLAEPAGPVRWQAVTDATVTLDGATATLEKGDRKLVFECADKSLKWTVRDATPPTPEEKPNTGFRIVSVETPKAATVTLGVTIRTGG